jgi:hypothetical protein
MYGRILRLWPEQTVFVVACGPSLASVDLELIRGFPVIAVNRSFEAVPWADILYFSDARFFRWYETGILAFQAQKYTVTSERKLNHPAITNLRKFSYQGLAGDPHYVCTGNNSGYAAINVAFHTGARRICLLGFDMKSQKGRHHWHGDHPVAYQEKVYRKLLLHYPTLITPLSNAGVEVFNCNLDSDLKCFPLIPLQRVLDECWSSAASELSELPA